MILYIACMCGRNKLLSNKYRDQGYEVRVANMNPEYRKQARSYGVRMPFTVVDNEVTMI